MFESLDLHACVLKNCSNHFIVALNEIELGFCLMQSRVIIKLKAFTHICLLAKKNFIKQSINETTGNSFLSISYVLSMPDDF